MAPAPGDAALAQAWMQDWIARNPPGTDVAWDAFTISARLMNWALVAAVLCIDVEEVRQSFLWQARYLATHLERDVLANHLLKNACALCVAGVLLDDSLLQQGLALLQEQIEEQTLPDGGHYERTPMYHALVLEDLLLVHAALGAKGDFLCPYIAQMARFLEGTLHPDGEIPFFGDTVLGESRTPAVLLALAGHAPQDQPDGIAFPDSGYYVHRDPARRMHLIVKAGPPGPAYQLGHAHADCLSYELSVDCERIIVNCGVHGYADSPHRAWCRSEAAHNTFEVAGKPQLELWGAFRVGRRYTLPKPPRLSTNGEISAEVVVGGSIRRRRFHLHDNGLNITDEAAAGVELVTRIHLAPGMAWEPCGDAFAAVRGKEAVLLLRPNAASAEIESTPYFPEFGKETQSACLCLRGAASVAYEITLPE